MYIPHKKLMLLSFAAAFTAAAFFFRKKSFFDRFVKPASAQSLALIRVMTCATAFLLALWEDPVSIAMLPRELALHRMGIMNYLTEWPLSFDLLFSNIHTLYILKVITVVSLFLSLIGYRTRTSLVIAFFSYLLFSGVIRIYFWFFHQGIIALYLLGALCLFPCADAWSVDAYLRSKRKKSPKGTPYTYGWGRYICWMTIALPYVLAGISKLRKGGIEWFHPDTLLYYMISTTLSPMQFDFTCALAFLKLPLFLVVLIAIFSVLSELSGILLLLTRWAHWVVPFFLIGLHLGILFMQNIFFPDLIFLLLMFPAGMIVSKRSDPKEYSETGKRSPYIAAAAAALFICVGIFSLKLFPVSVLPMFSTTRIGDPAVYDKIYLTDSSGNRQIAKPEQEILALHDTRYRMFIASCFEQNPKLQKHCDHFLRAYGKIIQHSSKYQNITQIEVEHWEWDFHNNPDNPNYGILKAKYIHKLVD